MRFIDYLRKTQPIALKVLTGAFSSGRLAHAYLLAGEPGLPLKEAAYFLAESFLCERPAPLACESCKTCERVRRGGYADFLFVDGSLSSIKKETIQAVMGDFSKTPLERRGIMVYVIHLVENMTVEAVNSLLKFLEEPPKGCYAILTSENLARVLPTIISRSETIRFVKAPYDDVVKDAVSLGVKEDDAALMALFLNDGELIKEAVAENDYLEKKALYEEAMTDIGREKGEGLYRFEKVLLSPFAKKEDARRLLILIAAVLKDAALLQEGMEPKMAPYAKIIKLIGENRYHLPASLREALLARSELDMNMAPNLVIDHLARFIYKDA